jgi:hypothetical protein
MTEYPLLSYLGQAFFHQDYDLDAPARALSGKVAGQGLAKEWGGWRSNPRPADYASRPPTSGQDQPGRRRTRDRTDRTPQGICPGDNCFRRSQVAAGATLAPSSAGVLATYLRARRSHPVGTTSPMRVPSTNHPICAMPAHPG